MSVIIELSIPTEEFKLGRILQMQQGTRITLETTVPLGERSIPFIRVFDEHEQFEASVREHDAVLDIHEVSSHDGEILYALDWDVSQDEFFQGIQDCDGTLIDSSGTKAVWNFELRFESHEALGKFQDYCQSHGIPFELERLYNPTKPDAGPWFGLTAPQRLALSRAVAEGYYNLPREISTKELAADFGVTDQAMSERLRRGVANLVSNTIHVSADGLES